MSALGELSFGDSSGVHAAFDLSYQRLTPTEARLFRLLSLNPGRQVSIAAAAASVGLAEGEAVGVAKRIGDRAAEAQAVPAGPARARDAQAQRLYREFLAFSRELGDRPGTAQALHDLGTVARERRHHALADEYYTAAMRLATEHGDRLREARVAVSRGILACRVRDHEPARRWWLDAIGRYEELGQYDMVRSVRKRLAKLRRR
ncbi:hypothetical protein ACIQMJ_15025 [Actinosynnema sp. NPDC091369]